MKTKFLTFVLLVFVMISCQNGLDNDLTLRMITSSKLTVKVVDSKGNSYSNVNIKLYDRATLSSSSTSISFSSLQYIYSAPTDSSGKLEIADVAAGTYFIVIDSVRVNGLNYQPIMQFQLNSAVDKTISINPEDYATTFDLTIQKTETSKTSSMVSVSAFNNLNILFIPYTSYSTNYSIEKLISLAEVSAKTNDIGNVSLKVPSFKSYVALVYNDTKTVKAQLGYSGDSYSYSSYTFIGDKGETNKYSYSLDSKTLLNSSYGVYNLSIKKAVSSATSTSPTLMAFDGLNVVAIPSSLYDSSLPLSILLESAELSGKTDAAGNISFSLKSNINYQFVVYNNDQSVYSTLYGGYFYLNTGETRQASFTLNSTTLTPVSYTRINITLSKTSSVYYTASPTDLTPFSNLQVALVPYLSSNSTSSIDNILTNALASGTTDASGQISFVLAIPSTYNTLYFQIVAYDAAKTTKFVSSSFYTYTGNSTSLSYYLNSTTLASVN